MAYAMIASETHDVIIASGVEVMSKYPIASDMGGTLPDGRPQGQAFGEFFLKRLAGKKFYNQGQAAEAMALKWDISRLECEQFAVDSHAKAHHATEAGYFKREKMVFIQLYRYTG